MSRFSPARFPPGFFDLPADAGQQLPLGVVAAWTRSSQTRDAARELLAPFTLRGTVVCSDAAGLTRLTQERSLIEILAMVSRPKELAHAYGKAIGGIPIGVWAADNTAMFYPEGVSVDHVVSMLLALLDRVQAECEVGIGICVHHGEFYELGQGIYGPDADRVEGIAEDFTSAGELVVTDVVARRLGETASFHLSPRTDLLERFGEVHRILDGPRLGGIDASDFHYPLPFTDEFYGGLAQFQRTRRTSVVPRPAYREVTVVVIAPEREDRDIPEVAALNDLALAAAIKRIGRGLVEDLAGTEVKTSSGVSIYLFDEARHAVDFARKLRDTLAAQGVALRMGMDAGRILLFELGEDRRDIAGSPVNVASKLAQDVGRLGTILLSSRVAELAGLTGGTVSDVIRVSGVTIDVIAL
jgi:class 3 adenylate cyclase